MPDAPPLTGADFYDTLPPPNHRTGDIWINLPTFGMLNRETATGIVITPACDLANRKTETITYLPVVSVSDYLASPACRHECWQEIVATLARLPDFRAVFPPSRFELICNEELDALIGNCLDSKGKSLTTPEIQRIKAYQNYVRASHLYKANLEDVKAFFKTDRFETLLFRLVTNALKPDIHFLPADKGQFGARPVPVHSIVLFRYPLSLPIVALDLAQNTSEALWQQRRTGSRHDDQAILAHMPVWPVKLASLRGEFLSDLISRYIGIHIRLGSADFTEQTVRNMCQEIGA